MAESADPRTRQITIELAGRKKSFSSFAELDGWIRGEWESFQQYGSNAGSLWKQANNQWQRMDQELQFWRNEANDVKDRQQELQDRLANLFSRIPMTESPEGKMVTRLVSEDVQRAAAAVSLIRNQHLQDVNDPQRFRGATEGVLFEVSDLSLGGDTLESLREAERRFAIWEAEAKAAVSENASALGAEIERASAHAIAAEERAEEYRNGLSEWSRRLQSEAAQLRDRFVREAGESLEKYRKEIETLVKTYDEQLALQWPTKYWKDKSDHHEERASKFSWAFAAATVVALVIVGILSALLVIPEAVLLQLVDGPTGEGYEPTPVLAKATAFGALLAIVFWVLKLLAKNMLSNQHLATDASERRVMIMTYLALMRRGQALPDEELRLILTPIFRPSSDGFVREESGPTPWLYDLLRGSR